MNKSLINVFKIYVFAFAFLFASRPIGDPDFWFHLKTGEYIFTTGIPRMEMWSFTHPGLPWTAHGWLSGVLFYGVWSVAGFKPLIFIFALLTAIAFWIAFKRMNAHPFFAGTTMLLAVWTSSASLGVRPRVFSILFASIFLALLGRFARGVEERWIWLLIPIMSLWANLHGGFFIGLALVGLTAVGMALDLWSGVFEKSARFRWRLGKLAIIFLGCALAVLVNPFGVKLYTTPIAVLRSPIFQNLVVDWLSPNFHLPRTRPLLLLLGLTIGALALSPRRPKPSEVLLFLASLYATLKTQRNAIVFSLVAAPLFADYFQSWFNATRVGKRFGTVREDKNPKLALLLTVVLLLPLIAFALRLRATAYADPTQQSMLVPVKAVEYLEQNGITGNTFAEPNVWGAYVFWAAPKNRVYIDGRDVYPDTFVKEFVDIVHGRVDWRKIFDERGVQIVLVEPGTLLAREVGESQGWEKIYEDSMSVVFRRR